MGRIDRRSAATRGVLEWQKRVIAELGGDARVTPVQRARVETAARTKLLLDHMDSHLLEPRTLFARKGRLRKDMRPLLDLRQRMAESFERAMAALGGATARARDGGALPSIADLLDAEAAPVGVARRTGREP